METWLPADTMTCVLYVMGKEEKKKKRKPSQKLCCSSRIFRLRLSLEFTQFLPKSRCDFDVKTPVSFSSCAVSQFYRLQQRHAAVFINGRALHRQSSLLKAEGIRSFIKCKTTDVMADFTPLWKVKQSAL